MEEKVLYTYGMRLRGYAPMCQPKDDLIAVDDDILAEYHNILLYGRRLTHTECFEYDLDYLGKRRLRA